VRLTELELTDINLYQNSLYHNEAQSFRSGCFTSISVYFFLLVYVLALFGALAVFKFFTS
jgi:hypothetical protein